MSENRTQYKPDFAVHPGEYLGEILGARQISQKDLAERLGVTDAFLSKVIHCEKPVGPDLSLKLERTLGISAALWSQLNMNYKLQEAHKNESERLKNHIAWALKFPLKWLSKNGLISSVDKNEKTVRDLLDFFMISSPERWELQINKLPVRLRQDTAYNNNMEAYCSWIRAAESIAENYAIADFNKNVLTKNLISIRKLTCESPDTGLEKTKSLLEKCGIVLIILSEPPGIHTYGAASHLNRKKAMIVLSCRRKTDDQFWFSFFHEAAHLLLHSKKRTYIDTSSGVLEPEEIEANSYAADLLIPPERYSDFIKRNQFDKTSIIAFSTSLGISPGILTGRLQHDKYIPFSRHNDLKIKVDPDKLLCP